MIYNWSNKSIWKKKRKMNARRKGTDVNEKQTEQKNKLRSGICEIISHFWLC